MIHVRVLRDVATAALALGHEDFFAAKLRLGGLAAIEAAEVERYAESQAWWPATGEKLAPEEWASVRALASGETTGISYEDSRGKWHDEVSSGGDRPETEVKG